MKRFLVILIFILIIAAVLSGCTGGAPAENPPDDGKISVVSTVFPSYDFARQIAGDKINLTMLLPPGAESHSFEPSAQDIIAIQNCDVFIYIGGDTDQWAGRILNAVDNGGMTVISMLEVADTVEQEIVEGMEPDYDHDDDHSGHDHDDEPELDEHVWTSPKNAKLIVSAISAVLCEKDKDNAAEYEKNTATYLVQLDELDAKLSETVQNAGHKTIIFGDRFPFRYLARDYGLGYFAAFPGCSTETEPAAATIAFLIDKVREENIPVVFHVELSNERMADAMCAATGAKKLLLHACHNISKDEFESGATYVKLMTNNIAALKEALQ